eukprot:gnl/MRDRNA2_/MRDRNA2_17906_c0_seq1.p1 gnl/MRDRNA2_/MRDRNA2_17906_c0~~gnl/MRDRNA2_/MRDRNA2_17906_c0_seq1.p1  ORF type:complete len:280 (+),score=65.89 gnl/MRDRNA2_/MRDRNA2_17906_c0_seq1:31-840(+)
MPAESLLVQLGLFEELLCRIPERVIEESDDILEEIGKELDAIAKIVSQHQKKASYFKKITPLSKASDKLKSLGSRLATETQRCQRFLQRSGSKDSVGSENSMMTKMPTQIAKLHHQLTRDLDTDVNVLEESKQHLAQLRTRRVAREEESMVKTQEEVLQSRAEDMSKALESMPVTMPQYLETFPQNHCEGARVHVMRQRSLMDMKLPCLELEDIVDAFCKLYPAHLVLIHVNILDDQFAKMFALRIRADNGEFVAFRGPYLKMSKQITS